MEAISSVLRRFAKLVSPRKSQMQVAHADHRQVRPEWVDLWGLRRTAPERTGARRKRSVRQHRQFQRRRRLKILRGELAKGPRSALGHR
jgi:hypothetical protein